LTGSCSRRRPSCMPRCSHGQQQHRLEP
jgi:hypothetical protein